MSNKTAEIKVVRIGKGYLTGYHGLRFVRQFSPGLSGRQHLEVRLPVQE
jgi:hypothetical protein